MRCPPADRISARPRGLAAEARLRVGRFVRDEDGSLMVFAMVLFLVMVMLGGFAVDLMRYEQRRTALQQTIDRSVLAAASLTQDLDPESVVNDYFDKAGLLQYLEDVVVTQGLNFRIVEARAKASLDTFFAHMVGVSDFDVPAHSEAEQRITKVEISMVLDVSGSMNTTTTNGQTRIANLRTAANSFVSKVKAGDAQNLVSISLIPFNGQINLGPTLRSKFNATHQHGIANVNCVDLPAAAYVPLTLSRALALPMTAHADTYSSTFQGTSYTAIQGPTQSSGQFTNNWCPPSTGNVVSLFQDNVSTLQSKINALSAIGATSINAAMRWGLAFLDPQQRPLVNEMIADGAIPSHFAGRPFDWTDEEAMKVIVLMTDGENFPEDRVNDTYKTGLSPIYYNPSSNLFVIRHTTGRPAAAGTREFWQPNLCTSTNCQNGSNTGEAWVASVPSGFTQQTWVQVWQRARVQWVAWQLYARALGTSSTTRTSTYNTWMANFRTQTATTAMDSQLQNMCDMAKAQGVLIYGVAVDAPANGKMVIRNCASSINYFFDTTGGNLVGTFNAIASNISQLRLTQ